jgi:hypothetical protein
MLLVAGGMDTETVHMRSKGRTDRQPAHTTRTRSINHTQHPTQPLYVAQSTVRKTYLGHPASCNLYIYDLLNDPLSSID